MQYAGQFEFAEILHVQSQSAGLKTQLLGHMDQLVELGPLERKGESLPQLRETYLVTMRIRY